MPPSDSEDDPDLNDVFDEVPSSDADEVNEEELFGDNAEDGTEHGDVSKRQDSLRASIQLNSQNSGSEEDDDDADGDGDADNDGDGDADDDEDEDEEMQDVPPAQREVVPLSASVHSPTLGTPSSEQASQAEHFQQNTLSKGVIVTFISFGSSRLRSSQNARRSNQLAQHHRLSNVAPKYSLL